MIDFSGLDQLDKLPTTPVVEGKAKEIPLSDIDEDPNQPRREFDPEAHADMVASIQKRGILQPVSVRPHPTQPNRYILNFGARRYRGAKAAGLETIPAFIDEKCDEYDQVIENEQRSNLSPMELAMFIHSRIQQGHKKGDIAKRLGKRDPMFVTRHLALIDAPGVIEALYREGRCRDISTLYNLRRLMESHTDEVTAWLATEIEITRSTVSAMEKDLGKGGALSADAGDGEGSGAGEPSGTSSAVQPDSGPKGERRGSSHKPTHALGKAKLIAEAGGVRGYLTPAGAGTGTLTPLDGGEGIEVALGEVRLVEWVT